MRAKFRLTKVTKHSPTHEELEFHAVTTKPFDAEGASEDNDFARWTPSGELKMTVTNPRADRGTRGGAGLLPGFHRTH
jgi:hypothetical protein